MHINTNLLFVDKTKEEEEDALLNEWSLEVRLFSALTLSEEDESAVVVLFLKFVFSLEVIISLVLEDISVEESDMWLNSSFVL